MLLLARVLCIEGVDTAEHQALVQAGLARTNFVWKTWIVANTLIDPLCPHPVYSQTSSFSVLIVDAGRKCYASPLHTLMV